MHTWYEIYGPIYCIVKYTRYPVWSGISLQPPQHKYISAVKKAETLLSGVHLLQILPVQLMFFAVV